MKIVVTGGTGFIGAPLVRALVDRGDVVTVLARDPARVPSGVTGVRAELELGGAWTDVIDGVDAIVHLAGESIAGKRWDARQKQLIRDSRIESTRMLVEAIARAQRKPRVLVTASGVDYYPFAVDTAGFDDDPVSVDDPPADSFLGRLCRDWEKEAFAAKSHGVRVVALRTGLVLGEGGGALGKLATPFRFFVGGPLGNGRQWTSWIDLADAVRGYLLALDRDDVVGPHNLVKESIRNREFAAMIGKRLGRPSWLPVPAFALRAAVGELAEYMLYGRRVDPTISFAQSLT